jgi:hypothetical protein
MTPDPSSTEATRLRCIGTILNLDDEALQFVDALLTRFADTDKPTERKPRSKAAKRTTATPTASVEVAR